jgi:predicted N-acyltransferase
MADEIALRVVRKAAEVERSGWDALVGGGTPFMKWDWLDSLEQSGCVNEKTGWLPHHLVVEKGNKLVAAAPMYLKLHSQGSSSSITNGPRRRTTPAFNTIQRCWSACPSLP